MLLNRCNVILRATTRPTPNINQTYFRHFYSTGKTQNDTIKPGSVPRLLSDLKERLGKCLMFGLEKHEVENASSILQELATDWRELLAGSEGFLTDLERTGLFRRQVIWGEMDVMVRLSPAFVCHVNNVNYNRYAETARVNWAKNYATFVDPTHKKEWMQLCTAKGDGFILKSITTDFKFPMTWPDHVTVYHKLQTDPGAEADEFVLDVLMLSERHQRPAARCVEHLLVYDYIKGRKTTLRPFMRNAFRETFSLQQESQKKNLQRMNDIIQRVVALEKASWDRPHAVER